MTFLFYFNWNTNKTSVQRFTGFRAHTYQTNAKSLNYVKISKATNDIGTALLPFNQNSTTCVTAKLFSDFFPTQSLSSLVQTAY